MDTVISFEKYQGVGSDFVIIDNTKNILNGTMENQNFVRKICNRQTGIGANGIVVVKSHPDYDYEVVHYNADSGKVGCLCGNGCRCAVRFVHDSGILAKREFRFLAYDGPHFGKVLDDGSAQITFADVNKVEVLGKDDYFINTGSPHHIQFVDDLDFDINARGLSLMDSNAYAGIGGTNVMFVKKSPNQNYEFEARSFERAVRGETDSCGTGAIAIAMAIAVRDNITSADNLKYKISFPGGILRIDFDFVSPGKFTNVWLTGPTTKVFEGKYKLDGYKK